MAYELRDHTADIAVAATGDTLERSFRLSRTGWPPRRAMTFRPTRASASL